MPNRPIIIALDSLEHAALFTLVEQLDAKKCRLKIGKELFTRYGPSLVNRLQRRGFDIFLDLKFHDIPNTVAHAVTAAADLGVWMVNVHASGGEKMLQAAREALASFGSHAPLLIAVTLLTHLKQSDLAAVGIKSTLIQQVERLALLAQTCGLEGVVCSAQEAALLRKKCGTEFKLVTPGIRPAGSVKNDQERIMTPVQAVAKGADYLVIGRPITQASDPNAAFEAIYRTLIPPSADVIRTV